MPNRSRTSRPRFAQTWRPLLPPILLLFGAFVVGWLASSGIDAILGWLAP